MVKEFGIEALRISPTLQSDDSSCGAACIKMVLNYFGYDMLESEINRQCGHTYENGVTNESMAFALEKNGVGAKVVHEMDFDDLRYYVSHKVPVIVDWYSASNDGEGFGHSSIVTYVDSRYIYLQDPMFLSTRKIALEDFASNWFDFDENMDKIRCVGIVCYPKRILELR
jgi:predicted double-glycine peptidase